MLWFYRHITRYAAPFLRALLSRRLKRGKEDPNRLNERMGVPSLSRPAGPLIWVHAASVGEVQAALILINKLHTYNILVTTGTRTSADLIQKRLPPHAMHQFMPLDHPLWVRQFLDHWRPDLALWMESELWPNMLMSIQEREIPAALITARMSESSFRGWSRFPKSATQILGTFAHILTQTDNDTARYQKLGSNHVITTDNIKYSAAPLPVDEAALSALKAACAARPVWVYASTHQGEESLAARIHQNIKAAMPDLLTVIVPRHPERSTDIMHTLSCFPLSVAVRSEGDTPTPQTDIYLADTMGELGLFYALADIAMIGRSFSDDGGGGHNPIEAAQLDCAVLTGPNIQFQKQLFADMNQSGAVIQVQTEQALQDSIVTLCHDPDKINAMKEKARLFATQKESVADNVMTHLVPLLAKMEA